MPHRLPRLIHSIAEANTPRQVAHVLNERAAPLWLSAIWSKNDNEHYEKPVWGESVPRKYIEDFREVQRIGHSPLGNFARRMRANPRPFTYSEARRSLNPTGRDGLLFDLLQDYGIRDGYVVPHGRWSVSFASEHVLNDDRLNREVRIALDAAARAAVYRLNELVPSKKTRIVDLSPRELAVLEHLSLGLRVPGIAEHMGIGARSVREYLQRAQKKLDAATAAEALVIAVRRQLI